MRPSRTITVSLPDDLAGQVDDAARIERRSRSEIFKEALRQYITRRSRWDRIFDYGDRTTRASGLSQNTVLEIVKQERQARRRSNSTR
jgi:metal-responsive CopG/Arc/MetJ family transcriptional regulator